MLVFDDDIYFVIFSDQFYFLGSFFFISNVLFEPQSTFIAGKNKFRLVGMIWKHGMIVE